MSGLSGSLDPAFETGKPPLAVEKKYENEMRRGFSQM